MNSSEEMDLIEADNKLTRTSYPGDAFPGTDGITSFTNCTRPAMKTWTGDVLDLPITEIAESRRGVVSFKVAGGLEPSAVPEALAAAEVGSYSFKARWRPVPNAVKYAVSISMEGVDDYVLVEEVPAEAAELLVSDLAPETEYGYTVCAYQIGKGASPASEKVEVLTGAPTFEWYEPSPVASPSVNDKGFTASWLPLEGATEYFVTLFRKTDMTTEADTQDFTGGVECLGEGWISSSGFTFLNDGYCGEGSPSLRMNGSGAALESAVYPTDIHSLVFWHRGSGKTEGNPVSVYAFVDEEWRPHSVVEVTEREGGRVDTVAGFPFGTRAVRICYKGEGTNRGPLALYDVTVRREVSFTKVIVNGMDRKSAGTATEMRIDGLEPGTEYFYTVVATDGELMSKESIPVMVRTYPLTRVLIPNSRYKHYNQKEECRMSGTPPSDYVGRIGEGEGLFGVFVLFHVVEDVLNVFVVLEFLEELLDGRALVGSNLFVVGGDALEFCRHYFHPFLLKEFLYVAELVERAGDEPFFLFGLEFGLEVHKVELEFLL